MPPCSWAEWVPWTRHKRMEARSSPACTHSTRAWYSWSLQPWSSRRWFTVSCTSSIGSKTGNGDGIAALSEVSGAENWRAKYQNRLGITGVPMSTDEQDIRDGVAVWHNDTVPGDS